MSANNWQVERSRRKCAVSGREFAAGEEYFSVLQEDGDGFKRVDLAAEVWATFDKTGLFSFWHTRAAAAATAKRLTIDAEAVYDFFTNLITENSPTAARALFRYLLALILLRQRRLRLDGISRMADGQNVDGKKTSGEDAGGQEASGEITNGETTGGEMMKVFDPRAKTAYEIPVPAATPAELAAAQDELNALLACN
ncbi:hypothetical protein FACS1894139_01530 [Planctomycetales bacterium]|nr:hypothetical protein FACS1894139_01530 [Planctomycetales bacterium]GHV21532.1 hypothetical protein AGMMS49959_10830 [Planctomycetales bacterium]